MVAFALTIFVKGGEGQSVLWTGAVWGRFFFVATEDLFSCSRWFVAAFHLVNWREICNIGQMRPIWFEQAVIWTASSTYNMLPRFRPLATLRWNLKLMLGRSWFPFWNGIVSDAGMTLSAVVWCVFGAGEVVVSVFWTFTWGLEKFGICRLFNVIYKTRWNRYVTFKRCSSWQGYVQPTIWPTSIMKDAGIEVWNYVDIFYCDHPFLLFVLAPKRQQSPKNHLVTVLFWRVCSSMSSDLWHVNVLNPVLLPFKDRKSVV